MAFQRSEGLLVDGIAGPRTLTALGLVGDPSLPSAVPGLTVQVASAMCPGAPLGNVKKFLPIVVEAMVEHDLVDEPMLLMAVATIRVETGRFEPIDEYVSRFNTSPNAHPPYFDLYDHRRDLGNLGPPDGALFKGRGFVQLTGRTNYARYSRVLGREDGLLREPELANDPHLASRLLARFLRDRELPIKHALIEQDYALARRWVNGGRHGLREFTDAYRTGERLLA
jgi:peptidoglycan L-alanyl-D-glutamate endopeptidase CwlK